MNRKNPFNKKIARKKPGKKTVFTLFFRNSETNWLFFARFFAGFAALWLAPNKMGTPYNLILVTDFNRFQIGHVKRDVLHVID